MEKFKILCGKCKNRYVKADIYFLRTGIIAKYPMIKIICNNCCNIEILKNNSPLLWNKNKHDYLIFGINLLINILYIALLIVSILAIILIDLEIYRKSVLLICGIILGFCFRFVYDKIILKWF